MHIVSYRGPGMAGGVSAALARAWDCNLGTGGLWWYLTSNELEVWAGGNGAARTVEMLAPDMVQGHYRFCNDFIWPVMHDLPEHARYNEDDHRAYQSFNATFAAPLIRLQKAGMPDHYFVQDYQLSCLPRLLRRAGLRSLVFWHVPWPRQVVPEHTAIIAEIAEALLQAQAIGFHTHEYAHNFMRFVQDNLPQYGVNAASMAVWCKDRRSDAAMAVQAVRDLSHPAARLKDNERAITRIVVAPLGIDFEHWSHLSSGQQKTAWHPAMLRTPFILSVDRADYTKGVTNRLRAIESFFDLYPEWQERIVFAQICGKTRSGLPAFESYWKECRHLYDRLRERFSTHSWQPLLWIEHSFTPAELAHVYGTAAAMFISAVRDGLNLTAKEYVACQGSKPGVLVLSQQAGAWHELGGHCLTINPHNTQEMAHTLHQAAIMDAHEREWRMAMMKETVRNNTLSRWWHTFARLAHTPQITAGSQLLETS